MLEARQQIHSGALVGVYGVRLLKNYGLFTSGGKIKSLEKKKPSKSIYFECNFNTKMLQKKIF